MTQPKPQDATASADLVQLFDQFVDFHDHCAFMCDAFACIAADEDGLDPSTVEGVRRYTEWLKRRAHGLKQDFRRIQERSARAQPA